MSAPAQVAIVPASTVPEPDVEDATGGTPPPVSPQDQVDFLLKLQRLLRSGETTSTYKYAMLIALADLAVELRDEVIPLDLVAEKFIELYWQMSVVYPGGKQTDILTQVTPSLRTPHATITTLLRDLIAMEKSLAKAKEKKSWSKLWSQVRGKVVQKYVLEALQRVDKQIDPFIYDPAKAKEEKKITLTPAAKLCFRQFYGLITDQARGAWLGFVRRFNEPILGEGTDLSAFLFGDGRGRLDAYVPLLQDLQKGRCFYCQGNLAPKPEVDHFVPWSLYHTDLGHNFVLAHRGCNGDKRDFLADEDHLARWVERNTTWAGELEAFFRNERLPFNDEATKSIARWAYDGLARTKGLAWRTGRTATAKLRGDWARLLST